MTPTELFKMISGVAKVKGATAPESGFTIPGKFKRVPDGDTVVVTIELDVDIRFDECYVPDKNKKVNDRAKNALKEIAKEGDPCTVFLGVPDTRSLGRGWSFNRWVGRVWLPKARQSLGEWQIKQGNASSTEKGKLGE